MPALPAVSFPVYGLSSDFVGSRGLGLWDRRQATSQEKDIVLPVFRVQLLHSVGTVQSGQPGRPAMVVKVSTICKRLADWKHPAPLQAAASAALFGLSELAGFQYPGEDQQAFLNELSERADRLSGNLDSKEWLQLTVRVDQTTQIGMLYRTELAWALVIDVGELVALGVSGCGVEPSRYGFARIDDIGAYERLF